MPNGNAGEFRRAEYIGLTIEQLNIDWGGRLTVQQLKDKLVEMKREVLYKSEYYQVAIDKETPHDFPGALIWHLSIKRIDKEPIMDWRDLQDIKNKLVGP